MGGPEIFVSMCLFSGALPFLLRRIFLSPAIWGSSPWLWELGRLSGKGSPEEPSSSGRQTFTKSTAFNLEPQPNFPLFLVFQRLQLPWYISLESGTFFSCRGLGDLMALYVVIQSKPVFQSVMYMVRSHPDLHCRRTCCGCCRWTGSSGHPLLELPQLKVTLSWWPRPGITGVRTW